MGFFSDLGSTFVRGAADVATFGTNELAGNPAGKAADMLLAGSDPGAEQRALAAQNIAEQEKFAQNSIQWRVQDAIKAGLSPLAALGASGSSFTPVSGPGPDVGPRDTLLDMLSHMGQDLFRSHIEAKSAHDREVEADNLRKSHAEADLAEAAALRSKLALSHDFAAPPNPAIPTVSNAEGFPYGIPSQEFARGQFGDYFAGWQWSLANRFARPMSDTWKNTIGRKPWSKYVVPLGAGLSW